MNKIKMIILALCIALCSSITGQTSYQVSGLAGIRTAKNFQLISFSDDGGYALTFSKYMRIAPAYNILIEREKRRVGFAFQAGYFSHEVNDSPDYDFNGIFKGYMGTGYMYLRRSFLEDLWTVKLGVGIGFALEYMPELTYVYGEETDMPGMSETYDDKYYITGALASLLSVERKLSKNLRLKIMCNYDIFPAHLDEDSYRVILPQIGIGWRF